VGWFAGWRFSGFAFRNAIGFRHKECGKLRKYAMSFLARFVVPGQVDGTFVNSRRLRGSVFARWRIFSWVPGMI
jgi:hypothetical protein